ncbi:hypothetical protein [Geodermatophilus sp. SYSU D01119]
MSETVSEEIEPPPAASKDVLAELQLLRQREGISMRKIEDGCPHLRRLRATTHELTLRRLAQGDRHVAAYNVIRCAVDKLVMRTRLNIILTRTLNLHGPDDSDLDFRRRALQKEMQRSERAYRRLEDEAYTHLAGALVSSEQSPCEAQPLRPKQAAEAMVIQVRGRSRNRPPDSNRLGP